MSESRIGEFSFQFLGGLVRFAYGELASVLRVPNGPLISMELR